MNKIGFGGGCHWCTEAVFQLLKGVESVSQGWISAQDEPEDFSEAVVVHFDGDLIPLTSLIEIHLRTHSSTSTHRFRSKYKSAVYVFSGRQALESSTALTQLQLSFDDPIITRVLRFHAFRANEERYLNYYLHHPEYPFCRTYIDPKVQMLKQRFSKETVRANPD